MKSLSIKRIVDFDNPHGEPCDLTFVDVCDLIRNCNRVLDQQLTKTLPHQEVDHIRGESVFQQEVDQFLANGGKVKRYLCVIIVDDEEEVTTS
jgi:hypothetical protein